MSKKIISAPRCLDISLHVPENFAQSDFDPNKDAFYVEWLDWDDASYKHMISATNVENAKEVLMNMAESLYQ